MNNSENILYFIRFLLLEKNTFYMYNLWRHKFKIQSYAEAFFPCECGLLFYSGGMGMTQPGYIILEVPSSYASISGDHEFKLVLVPRDWVGVALKLS